MKYFSFKKLVRDKITKLMEGNNQYPEGVRILSDEEYLKELVKKLVEEAKEIENVNNVEGLKEEIADLQEILDYIKKVIGFTEEEVNKLQKIKRDKNGGFDKKEYIDKVGVEEESEWYKYYKKSPEKYPELSN